MNITEVSIRKPVLAWMLMAAAVVFGAVAMQRIGVSQYPDVDYPTISVRLSWEGAAPEAMEHDVVEPIEEALSQVEGIKSITSSSQRGAASVTIELDLARKVPEAVQDVQSKIEQIRQRLPRELDPPVVQKSNPEDQPIMWVGLYGPYSPQVLADTVRYRIKSRLETVPGIGEVMMGGYVERNVRIWVRQDRMRAERVTVSELLDALRREHVELPAGQLDAGGREINVRVLGEALDLETLRNIVVRQAPGATPLRLGELTLIEDGFEDVRRITRTDGLPAQGMGVKKQRGANAVAVAHAVKEVLKEVQPTLPEGMTLGIIFDSTPYIEDSVKEVQWELMLSVILTALVCWMFLGSFSSTINVVMAIPMSLLGTIAVIYFLGFTLNTFTLLALSLAVGIVVDDAIMVLENIHRHAEGGMPPAEAARKGTAEITFAALAATLAVVAIFLPVIFMEGVIGRFFLQFGITLSIAVLLSYLEAITLAPSRMAQLLRFGSHRRTILGRIVEGAFNLLGRGYRWILGWGLRMPIVVLGLAGVLLWASFGALKALPVEMVPSQDQGRLIIMIRTAVGSNLHETNERIKKAEAIVNANPDIARAFAIAGGFGSSGVNAGIFFVSMKPREQRSSSQADLAATLRKELNSIPGLRAMVQDPSQSGFGQRRGYPVEFSVRGPDWPALVDATRGLMETLRESGVVSDLDSDYQLGMPELRIEPDREKAMDQGVPIETIATALNALVGGVRAGKYSSGGRRVDVRVRLMATDRQSPEAIGAIEVRNSRGDLVPLERVVTWREVPSLQSVTRKDRERAITVTANVAPGHSQDEALALVESLGKDAPGGTHVVLGGASVALRESMDSLIFALLLGVVVAFMILASQFNSLLHPVTVLTILPLSLAGAAWALLWGSQTLNIFSMIGLLLLMGIVKKNSIVLVDYANQRRLAGDDARQAMMAAGPVRLRPILMTSITTAMAALPASFGIGPGHEIRQPMAIAVIGGLVVSTALSLLVVPAFYVLVDDVRRLFGRIFRRSTAP